MLEPIKHILASQRIVLASSSPRRKLILENVGMKFEVHPSKFEENLDKAKFSKPYEYCLETARLKTLEVADKLYKESKVGLPDLIIGADTIVTMDDKIFEKPNNKEHALEMLSGFSGRSHTVYTGVILVTPKGQFGDVNESSKYNIHSFHVGTDVTFANVDRETLRQYIETGEPMDKAGGYGIQAAGGTLVESIHGDYFNVMGFPLHKFSKTLVDLYKNL